MKVIQRYIKLVGFLGFIFLSFSVYAASSPWVFDAINKPGIPRNFRSLACLPNNHGAHAIASAQFSEEELSSVLARSTSPIVIVDLRQESHGFLNGHAVSWCEKYNWGNRGKSAQCIEKCQAIQLDNLAKEKNVVAYFSLKMSSNGDLTRVPYRLPVHVILSEAALAKKYHVGYFRVYVTDNCRPTDAEVDRFVHFVHALPADTTLYFHCRAGRGRTTTFMAMYDMMHNAPEVSFTEIMRRQFLMGGSDLLVLPERGSYKYPMALARKQFLEAFYQSCARRNAYTHRN